MNGIMEGSAVAGLPTEERGELAEEDVESGGEGSLQGEELSIDGVVEDLSSNNLTGERLEFVLKKWYDMDRSREFRLFVRGNVLIGESLHFLSKEHRLTLSVCACRHLATRLEPLPAPPGRGHAGADQVGSLKLLPKHCAKQVCGRTGLCVLSKLGLTCNTTDVSRPPLAQSSSMFTSTRPLRLPTSSTSPLITRSTPPDSSSTTRSCTRSTSPPSRSRRRRPSTTRT